MSCLCRSVHSLRVGQRFETVDEQFLHWRLHLDTEMHGSLAATITMTKLLASVLQAASHAKPSYLKRDRHTRNTIFGLRASRRYSKPAVIVINTQNQ